MRVETSQQEIEEILDRAKKIDERLKSIEKNIFKMNNLEAASEKNVTLKR